MIANQNKKSSVLFTGSSLTFSVSERGKGKMSAKKFASPSENSSAGGV
jgi:hypothetical protein